MIHSPRLKDRESSYKKTIDKLRNYSYKNFKVEKIIIIDKQEPNDITVEYIQNNVDYNPVQEANLAYMNQFLRNLHINQLSNVLKHYEVLNIAKEYVNTKYHLVLEDDLIFGDHICEILDVVFNMVIKNKYNLVFLGIPAAKEVKEIIIDNVKNHYPHILPSCDSYIISTSLVKKMHEMFMPIKFTCNFQFSYVLGKLNTEAYMSTPNVFVNGSKFGTFISTLNPNSNLVYNKDFLYVSEVLSKDKLNEEEMANLEKIFSKSQVVQHPCFQHMLGLFYQKKIDYKKAEECFDSAYKTIIKSNGIINHDSSLLRDYIVLHKHIQELPA